MYVFDKRKSQTETADEQKDTLRTDRQIGVVRVCPLIKASSLVRGRVGCVLVGGDRLVIISEGR